MQDVETKQKKSVIYTDGGWVCTYMMRDVTEMNYEFHFGITSLVIMPSIHQRSHGRNVMKRFAFRDLHIFFRIISPINTC